MLLRRFLGSCGEGLFKAPQPKAPPAELPYPDIHVQRSRRGVEEARDRGVSLLSSGLTWEPTAWLSNGLCVVHSGEVADVPIHLHASLHANRALAHAQQQEWEEAEADCVAALRLCAQPTQVTYLRALARCELGQFSAALEDVEQVLTELADAPQGPRTSEKLLARPPPPGEILELRERAEAGIRRGSERRGGCRTPKGGGTPTSTWSLESGFEYEPRVRSTLNRLFPGTAALGYARQSLAAAHLMTAQRAMDDLVWNHISARVLDADSSNQFLITPGEKMFEEVGPGDLVLGSDTENETGDIIHGAIYKARPDVKAIVHSHTPAIVAVSTLPGGLRFLSQDAARFFERVAVHPYEGLSTSRDEERRLGAAMGAELMPGAGLPVVLMMANHGGVTVGRSVEEAWVRMYYLDVICKQQLLAGGAPSSEAPTEVEPEMLRHARSQSDTLFPDGRAEWPALLRRALASSPKPRSADFAPGATLFAACPPLAH